MWTFIKKDNVNKYINQHSKLKEYFEDICLFNTDDAVFLPRYIHKVFPSNFLETTKGNKKSNFLPLENIKFTGKLRDEQKQIVNHVIKLYNQNKNQINGIIKARPGLGKTVLSIYLAVKLKLKVCIIVDSTNLLEQWIKEILNFTDLTAKDIGLIKQKNFTTNKPFTIAMVQTLHSKLKDNFVDFFNKIDSSNFNLIIYDEVHKSSSAPEFSKTTLLFRTKNIIGLSATPFNYGVHEILMKHSIGEIIFETKKYDLKPIYCLLYYNSKLNTSKTKQLYIMKELFHKRAIYNKIIVESTTYLNKIVDITQRLLNKKHRIIIICFTKKQVLTISQWLTNNKIKNRRFYGEEREIDKKNDNVIVATYSYAGTGFDFKELSSLILACPLAGKKSLIQVIGRILRLCNNKITPVVVDLIDLCVPTFSLPDVKRKKKIINEEFDCQILEVTEN